MFNNKKTGLEEYNKGPMQKILSSKPFQYTVLSLTGVGIGVASFFGGMGYKENNINTVLLQENTAYVQTIETLTEKVEGLTEDNRSVKSENRELAANNAKYENDVNKLTHLNAEYDSQLTDLKETVDVSSQKLTSIDEYLNSLETQIKEFSSDYDNFKIKTQNDLEKYIVEQNSKYDTFESDQNSKYTVLEQYLTDNYSELAGVVGGANKLAELVVNQYMADVDKYILDLESTKNNSVKIVTLEETLAGLVTKIEEIEGTKDSVETTVKNAEDKMDRLD